MAKKGLNIYRRKDGRWEGRYKNGYTADGKARYSSIYGKSYSAVKEKLEIKRAEVRDNIVSCNCTLSEIFQKWLNDIQNKVKESTLANYEMKLRKHILPYFSGVKYDYLTADNINLFISQKFAENLSAKYIADIVILLKSVAKFAQKRYGYANRIDSVVFSKVDRNPQNRFLSGEEQSILKSALTQKPTCSNVGILLASVTGIRIGELCALKWENIDFEKSILTVRQTVQRVMKKNGGTRLIVTSPKSVSSVREIPLPDFIVPYLKSIRSLDDCYLLSGSNKIVEPRTMQYRFKSVLKKEKLPSINFHALRHMFATNCVNLGFDVKTLSEILGHSSVQVTLNCYVHSSLEHKKSCMKLFSDSFAA